MNDNAPSTPPDRANDPARRPINSAPDTASQAPSASTEQTSLSWCNVGGHELSKDQKPHCFDPNCENFGKQIGSDDHRVLAPTHTIACDNHVTNDPASSPIIPAPDFASRLALRNKLSRCDAGDHTLHKLAKPYCFDPDCENFGKEIGSDDHPIDSPINAVACDYHLEIKCPHGVKNDRCEDCNSNICKHGTKKKSEFASDDDNRCVECIEEKPKKPYTPPAYIVAQRRRASGHRN